SGPGTTVAAALDALAASIGAGANHGAQLVSNSTYNDYAPSGWQDDTQFYLINTAPALATFTGFAAPAAGKPSTKLLQVVATTSSPVLIRANNTGSVAANRVQT